MSNPLRSVQHAEKAVLIGVCCKRIEKALSEEYLEELSFLAETAGALPMRCFTQYLEQPHPATYVGKGKATEIGQYIRNADIDLAIFDDSLTLTQVRNLEKIFGIRVIDRNNLILDIFASRAHTAHAKVQVELAQYDYLLPRLPGMWTHLERQKGGIGLRGPGEREIETDRRIIRQKIARLKSKLRQIDKQKATQRSNRGALVRVALVGYTNAGKSTVMNLLSHTNVFAENKLFATLDTTVRKVVIGCIPFLLSDTVGFIRKLPHQLIESFKSTLDEVREADLLVHVVDISHPSFESQIDTVHETLADILALDKPIIMLFNKTDLYMNTVPGSFDYTGNNRHPISLPDLEKSWMNKNGRPTVFISATKRMKIDAFRKLLFKEVKAIHRKRYPNFLTTEEDMDY